MLRYAEVPERFFALALTKHPSMTDRTRARSAAYQFRFYERSYDPTGDNWLVSLPGPDAFDHQQRLLMEQHSDLLELLYQRVESFLLPRLTDTQIEVLADWAHGVAQTDTGARLGVNQSSVVKSRAGNTTYVAGQKGKHYGGFLRRLRTLANEDAECQRLLGEIQALTLQLTD